MITTPQIPMILRIPALLPALLALLLCLRQRKETAVTAAHPEEEK